MNPTEARNALERVLHEAAKVPALEARIAHLTVMAGEPIHYPHMVSGPPCPWCGSTSLESNVALRDNYQKGERNAYFGAVRCPCGARGPWVLADTAAEAGDRAMAKWSQRGVSPLASMITGAPE